MSPCLLPYPPVRLPSQGILQEAKFQSGPTPVIARRRYPVRPRPFSQGTTLPRYF